MLVASTHDEQRSLACDCRSQLLDVAIHAEDVPDLAGQLMQAVDDGISAAGKRDAVFAELQGHHD